MFFLILLVTGLLVVSPITSVTAQQQDSDNDGISDSKEEQLAFNKNVKVLEIKSTPM